MKKIISVINQKGGVGKTTTSTNLACGLAIHGYKVLLIDMDPQGHSTIGVGMGRGCTGFIQDVLLGKKKMSEVIVKTNTKDLHVVGSNINLTQASNTLYNEHFRETKLKKALAEVEEFYDYIIIDCHPSLGVLEINALYASNFVLVPTDTGRYSLDGFASLIDTVKSILGQDKAINEYLRILITLYDSREKGINAWVTEELEEFSSIVLETKIRKISGLKQAQIAEVPIMEYDAKSAGTKDYIQLTQELLKIW